MRTRTFVLAGLAALPSLSGVARAQTDASASTGGATAFTVAPEGGGAPSPGLFELGLGAGYMLWSEDHKFGSKFREGPVTSPRPPLDDGIVYGLNAGTYFLPWLGAELELRYIPTGYDDPVGESADIFGARAQLLAGLPGRFSPYVSAGFGAMNLFSSDERAYGEDLDYFPHYGAGLKVYLSGPIGLRADFRHLFGPGQGNVDVANHVELSGGAFVVLGAREDEDPDRDGFLGARDACPFVAGIAPDGCPDTDGDGIQDKSDACPQIPGPPPTGCPAKDSDGDGLADDVDRCPQEPEDKDNFQDEDGCPEPDNDADGIPDVKDRCPNVPETRNGFQDEDGCPDTLPAEVARFTGVIKGINFEFNEARITPDSRPVLDEAVKVLKQYPDLRIEISGHTDNVGTREFNLKLSSARAAAVRDYLVQKGVAANRIETRGAAFDEPRRPNDTPEGRAENRRIEFKMITRR